jgi:ATP-dependent exoDNAse (exonuclease V) beta subunit
LALGAPAEAAADVEVAKYGEALTVDAGLTGTALGSYLHRCFEVLGARPDFASRIAELTGVAVSEVELNKIAAAVGGFEAWVKDHFEPEAVQREWPLLHVDSVGTVVSGTADVLVHTRQGAWIVDHKSDWIDDPVQGFAKYQPQLQAYAEAVEAAGTEVAGVAVNWVRRGEVVMKQWQGKL